MTEAPQVSVILPTYNEADNILDLVDAIDDALADLTHEIIVVDDDSPDGTWKLVASRIAAAGDDRLQLIHRTADRGLTQSLVAGVRAARGGYVAWMDCDFSMPPEKLPELIGKLDRWDIAVGSRFVGGGQDARDPNPVRRWASVAITQLARLVLIRSFRDYTSGFIALRRSVLDTVRLHGNYGEYFIAFIFNASRAGYRIVEVPYSLGPRRAGQSKTDDAFLRFGSLYLTTIIKLRMQAMLGRRR